MTIRKKYSKEFQLDAVSRLHEQDYSRTEAAKSLEINIQMLGRWRKEYQSEDGLAFGGNGKLTSEPEENGRLKTQLKRFETKQEIFKKAMAFFAEEAK